jgi:hypothetical protein
MVVRCLRPLRGAGTLQIQFYGGWPRRGEGKPPHRWVAVARVAFGDRAAGWQGIATTSLGPIVNAGQPKCGGGVCRQTIAMEDPYTGMNIAGATGMSEAQKLALKALGAVEKMA